MADLKHPMYRRNTRNLLANVMFEKLNVPIKNDYPTATGLPAAADVISIRRFRPNLDIISMKVMIAPGGAWTGGNIDLGWTLDGPHPDDQVQRPLHSTPHVDETLFGEPTYFGTGIAPAAAPVEVITGSPIGMLDWEYNGEQPWRAFDWELTMTPAGTPAEGDELLILLMTHSLT